MIQRKHEATEIRRGFPESTRDNHLLCRARRGRGDKTPVNTNDEDSLLHVTLSTFRVCFCVCVNKFSDQWLSCRCSEEHKRFFGGKRCSLGVIEKAFVGTRGVPEEPHPELSAGAMTRMKERTGRRREGVHHHLLLLSICCLSQSLDKLTPPPPLRCHRCEPQMEKKKTPL